MSSRIVIVLGAGPGLGLEIGRRFGREGFRVVLGARQQDTIARLAKILGEEDIEAEDLCIDAADPVSLRSGIEDVCGELGDPDVLVYNAAGGPPGGPTHLDPEAVLDGFRVNVVGALVAAQTVIPLMREHGRGSIFFTGEGHSLSPQAEAAAIGMGKAALRNLAFSLSQEVEQAGIHVATVTVNGPIAPQTAFDPSLIADSFWQLYSEPAGSWSTEVVFHGRPQ